MRFALAFTCLWSVAVLAADATGAIQKLEAARAALATAVERIKVDPPSTADLDAAHDAVEALKSAVDGGGDLEQNDLDYAKAALAARKELRTLREYVDQRRANVKIHDARRAIDAAVKPLNEASAKVKAKDPAPADFAVVRSSAEGLKKLADDARPFGKQDPKFAGYLAELDATLARALAAADERETALAVEALRAQVETARAALRAALDAVGKDATDDLFKAVDRAAADLDKRLDEGKPLEGKSKAWQADAAKARAELAAAKKKADELWTATGLARLKAEIDPQYKDLQAARTPLRGRPSADQLAEARTAAIVVRKLVEKFQPEAERSQAFGQYVAQVRATLVDVETQIEERSLAAAQRDVGIAQQNVEKPSPSDDQFHELATAITVLDKTLGTVHADEPQMTKPVAEARWALREARKTFDRRRLEVDVERQTAKVEDSRKIAAEAMAQLQQPAFGKEQVQQAETAVKLIGSVLEQGTPLVEQDKRYAYYVGEVQKRVVELGDKIAAKKVALAARLAGIALTEAVATAKAKIETAKAPDGKDSDLLAAVQSVDAITKGLEAQAELEKQNAGYAAKAEKARNDLVGIADLLEFTKLARELRKKTGEALMAGVAATDQGKATAELRARKGKYERALSLFKSCQADGAELTRGLPALARLQVLVDSRPQTPREVMDGCAQRATEAEQLMKDVAPLIKFEDGPRKSYENGKSLLAQAKKPEALAQFNECIATGVLLQHDHPEMTDRKFDVAGGQPTLGEIIKFCQTQRKALLPPK